VPAAATAGRAAATEAGPAEAAQLAVQVLETRPHQPDAFTQGLLLHEGRLFESTGLEGRSSLREVDPQSGAVLRRWDVDDDLFAEGLALVDDRLIQLTWQNGRALVYDIESFHDAGPLAEYAYEGEGWGLCYDGARLVMTDGSSDLFFRDPTTFELQGSVPVTLDGRPVVRLNELECVGDEVYANVWQTDHIVRIDPATGTVTAVVDAAGLLTDEERPMADVLNGIAYDPSSRTFLITGKLWPKMFEVRFVQSSAALPFAAKPLAQ
jgi:glutaminyl-peptide cyclotransferase